MKSPLHSLRMSPLRALREHQVHVSLTKETSTQAGFARLVSCSESLIRAIESGRRPMTGKFARQLSTQFGVPVEWLMQDKVTEADVPAINPGTANIDLAEQDVNFPIPADLDEALHGPLTKRYEPDPRKRFRRKIMSSVTNELYELFSACSDEELVAVASELREWTYLRLSKMEEPIAERIAKTGSSRPRNPEG